MSTKSSKILIIIGASIGLFTIFFFFMHAVEPKEGVVIELPTIFDYIFATRTYGQIFGSVRGLVIVFALQLIIIILGLIIVIGLLTKKIPSKAIVILTLIDCALLLVTSIMVLCTKNLVGNTIARILVKKGLTPEEAKEFARESLDVIYLAIGPKLYGGLGIASSILCGLGLIIHKDNTY